NLDFTKFGNFSTTITILFNVALALGALGVFSAIAVFLVIRIVALWVLLMVSPVAYAADVLPSTTGVRSQWWQHFLQYAFFTPIMSFFINMTAIIANSQLGGQGVLQNITAMFSNPVQNLSSLFIKVAYAAGSFADSNTPGISEFIFKVASNVLLLV